MDSRCREARLLSFHFYFIYYLFFPFLFSWSDFSLFIISFTFFFQKCFHFILSFVSFKLFLLFRTRLFLWKQKKKINQNVEFNIPYLKRKETSRHFSWFKTVAFTRGAISWRVMFTPQFYVEIVQNYFCSRRAVLILRYAFTCEFSSSISKFCSKFLYSFFH